MASAASAKRLKLEMEERLNQNIQDLTEKSRMLQEDMVRDKKIFNIYTDSLLTWEHLIDENPCLQEHIFM